MENRNVNMKNRNGNIAPILRELQNSFFDVGMVYYFVSEEVTYESI